MGKHLNVVRNFFCEDENEFKRGGLNAKAAFCHFAPDKIDEIIVRHGVTIVGKINLATSVPYHASRMYARNVSAFLTHLVKDGKLNLDPADDIVQGTMLTRDGEIVNPQVRQFYSLPALEPQRTA